MFERWLEAESFSGACPTFGVCPVPEVCFREKVNGQREAGALAPCATLFAEGASLPLVTRTAMAPGLIELALAAGFAQEAHTAIVALDQVESAAEDLEEEPDGDGATESLNLICLHCGGTGSLGAEEIA